MSATVPQATIVGRKVLAGLAKAHQRAAELVQARTRALEAEVLTRAAADIAKGNRAWGRAGRIRRKMGGVLSERQTKRILDRLAGMSESVEQNGRQIIGGLAHAK
jgi:hypothetical protein